MLKLNNMAGININDMRNSNTTLVKVKLALSFNASLILSYSNTTLVKVKSKMRSALLPDVSKFKYNSC